MSGQWPEERRPEDSEETGPWDFEDFEEEPEHEPGGYASGGGPVGGAYGGGGYTDGGYDRPDLSGHPAAYRGRAYTGALGREPARRPRGKPRRASGNGPWPELSMLAAVAVIIAAVALAVSSAHPGSAVLGPATTTAVSSPVGSPTEGSPASAAPSTTAAPAHPSSTALSRSHTPRSGAQSGAKPGPQPGGPSAENLVVPQQVRQALVTSWLAANPGGANLGTEDVAGITKGALYYGYQPRQGVYWALAQFEPSARLRARASTAAGQVALARFTGTTYVFSWKPGAGNWTLIGQVPTGSCPGQVPKPVLAVWALCGLRPASPSPAQHRRA